MNAQPPPLPSKNTGDDENRIESHDNRHQEYGESVIQKPVISDPLDEIQIDLPIGLDEAKTHVIHQLSQSPHVLQGLYEASSEGESIYNNQKQLAEQNIEEARRLLAELNDIDLLRQKAQKSLDSTRALEQEWFEIEQQMYRELQPFSNLGLKSKLESSVKESESMSNVLANSFLDGNSTESMGSFIKQYRQERQTFHLRKEKLQRWNEDRVS